MARVTIIMRDDIRVVDPSSLIDWYHSGAVKQGPMYYCTWPVEKPHLIEFGDLAWRVLLAGRPSPISAESLLERAPIDIKEVPTAPLHELDEGQQERVIDVIVEIASLRGFRSALASKILHPKRRASVPVLDNQAIYGALTDPHWRPGKAPRNSGTRRRTAIAEALHSVCAAVARNENVVGWGKLEAQYPGLERIELFDMCWWALVRGQCEDGPDGWRLLSAR